MKHATVAAVALALSTLTAAVSAADNQTPNMMQWQERMQQMDMMLDQARKSNDPQQHQKLMNEHMQSMQEGMGMMKGMMGQNGMGGPMSSGKDAGKGMGSMDINQRMEMMQNRMDMMQTMMQHMMGQQAEEMRMGPGMRQGMGPGSGMGMGGSGSGMGSGMGQGGMGK